MLTAHQLRLGGSVKLGDTLLHVSKTYQAGFDLCCLAIQCRSFALHPDCDRLGCLAKSLNARKSDGRSKGITAGNC
jgi:hypothetical protein